MRSQHMRKPKESFDGLEGTPANGRMSARLYDSFKGERGWVYVPEPPVGTNPTYDVYGNRTDECGSVFYEP